MLTAMGDVMRKCYDRGFITTRDGNISVRKSLDGKISNYMYVTPAGWRKTIIHPEHIHKIKMSDIEDEQPLVKGISTEFWMHYYLLEGASSTRSVVHVHPTHVVAAMYAGWDLQKIAAEFPELKRYTRVGPTVPFFEAGTESLAINTFNAFSFRGGINRYDIVGQKNHGVCSIGNNPWDAYEHIERLNHICEIVLASGVKPK